MSEQLSKDGVPKDSKILAFQQKAPVNKEGRSTSICNGHYYDQDVINAADQYISVLLLIKFNAEVNKISKICDLEIIFFLIG